ncbi:MAG: chromosome segregation protein SMC [Candidatus Fermentibacteria bacterium]|nr:chromosome segregation protein SMC [Candidatus Fermentibacteria bacterium]
MRLKRLEIVGFKSFADPFRIDFKSGISTIVGPNGCGKSNVADAIRWVLGNQSPKQLRADRMESVIFSGSTKRKQLGMAEVTLTFDNTDRRLGLEYDEVSVSRRLFRTGESEYSINGSRCRLMDITDLVVDKGLGSTGYWILESKMVGTILSSRPEDRRFLFDEAAGIVKYKIQRHRAELKLNSAGSDLERLSDIISEVETTCNGLKRQVSAFKRHQKVSDTVKAVKEAMSFLESSEIREQLKEKGKLLDETGSVVGIETAALASRSAVLAEARVEFSRVQGKLDDAHRKCAELDSSLASCDRETAVTAERITSSETRIAENNARISRERERIHRYASDLEKLTDEQSRLDISRKSLEEDQVRSQERLEEIKLQVKKVSGDLSDARSVRHDLDAELEKLRQSFREQIRLEEARIQKLSSVRGSIELLAEREAVLSRSVSRFSEDQVVLQEKTETIEGFLQKKIAAREKLLRETGELSNLISRSGQAVAVLREQVGRVSRLFQESSASGSLSSIIKPLPGMGKAIGAFLDGFNSAHFAESIAADTQGEGRRYVVPASVCSIELPMGAVSLVDCVEKGDASRLTGFLLSHCVLAPHRETALKWIEEGLSIPVVTAAGDIFRPDGLVRLGVAESTAGSLELADILNELETQLTEAVKSMDDLNSDLSRKNTELSSLAGETMELRSELRIMEKKLVGTQTSLENSEKEFKSVSMQLAGQKEELKKLDTTDSGEAGIAVESSIAFLEDKRTAAVSSEEAAGAVVSMVESQLGEAGREQDKSAFNLRENNSRKKEITSRIDMLGKEEDNLHDLLQELQRENDNSGNSITSLKNRTDVLKKESSLLKEKRGQEEILRNNYSRERNTLMESTAVLEKEVQQIREKLGRAKSLMIELETRTVSLQEKLRDLEGEPAVEENPFLGRSPQELAHELVSRNALLERIGPVNMLAVSEYEEARERLEYLVEQRDDLEKARASLARAIAEINAEAAARFKETFDKVRVNFQTMFIKLFGGGEGDIIAIEGDDPLEGGIEIMARPKGKKLKNVIALSAGEKALTAVALLFSLYLVKPSPFCVLDELDGPFDDSNTDKFIAILRDFTVNTQFIVITHNKRTMEGADVLYGITMAEEGVSTITSVSLEEMVQQK